MVFDKGYLLRMIVVSGVFLLFFSFVNIDNIIYVDGGVVNNYFIDEVKVMGVDIIIGVDV